MVKAPKGLITRLYPQSYRKIHSPGFPGSRGGAGSLTKVTTRNAFFFSMTQCLLNITLIIAGRFQEGTRNSFAPVYMPSRLDERPNPDLESRAQTPAHRGFPVPFSSGAPSLAGSRPTFAAIYPRVVFFVPRYQNSFYWTVPRATQVTKCNLMRYEVIPGHLFFDKVYHRKKEMGAYTGRFRG